MQLLSLDRLDALAVIFSAQSLWLGCEVVIKIKVES